MLPRATQPDAAAPERGRPAGRGSAFGCSATSSGPASSVTTIRSPGRRRPPPHLPGGGDLAARPTPSTGLRLRTQRIFSGRMLERRARRAARPRRGRRSGSRCRRSRRRTGSPAARRPRWACRPARSATSLNTTTRSVMVSASSWSWVTNRNVMPTSRWIDFSSTCICSRSLRSSAPSGSSSRSTLGRLTRARASATRCRWPPESWLGAGRPSPSSRTVASASRRLRSAAPACHPLDPQAVGDVLQPRHVREQRVVLEHRVDVAVERRLGRDVMAAEHGPGRRSAARSRRSCAARWSCRIRRVRASW